ncbi:Tetratricopeptide repeat protein [Pseudoruegeria aquimaris]|uniref:Tetratricopeptide repeat protein n=1 Tax=Pseudoruegeria aquimaris TaxID=393663 RepID=A0A1Y5SCR1_9RHOB|nr:VWA domain-containing protein [Pseudoruegeria aquimaris]SLN37624.1 Tetratricopeptide repeat protein [Pseudoruegeria aquimaris]
MTALAASLEAFHFLRPYWLLGLPPVLWLWWRARRSNRPDMRAIARLPAHIAEALTLGAKTTRALTPVDGIALALICAALGAAGPTWSRVPNPFVSQLAPVVIVMEASEEMRETDVAPDRMERAKQKVRDLLRLRAGGRNALITYAGSAHRVVPFTEDPEVITPYLEGLGPEIMPEPGRNATAALALAQAVAEAEEGAAALLFVLSTLDQADAAAFAAVSPQIAFLVVAPEGRSAGALDGMATLTTQRVTPDGSDVAAIDRQLNAAYRAALLQDERQQWDDRGWILAWPAALLLLLSFRRGWVMRWAMIAALAFMVLPAAPARADGLADWFLTPDQQGQIAFNRKDYARAAELFTDPEWQAYSLYKSGQYAEAAEAYARLESSNAAMGEGMAHIKNRAYRDGVRAFEKAVERDPENAAAAENLEISKEIVEYVESTREQSDTGEEQGIGADDVVFDNESARGTETQIDATESGPEILTAEQWMNTVDTRTGDFLRQRFVQENATQQAGGDQ